MKKWKGPTRGSQIVAVSVWTELYKTTLELFIYNSDRGCFQVKKA